MGNTIKESHFEYINLSELSKNEIIGSRHQINPSFKNKCSKIFKKVGIYDDIIMIILNYTFNDHYSIILRLLYKNDNNIRIHWIESKTAISGNITYNYYVRSSGFHFDNFEINLENYINVVLGNCKLIFYGYSTTKIFDCYLNLIDNYKYKYLKDCNKFLKKRYAKNANIISILKEIEVSNIFRRVIVINPYFCDELNMFYFKNPSSMYILPTVLKHLSFIIRNNDFLPRNL